MDIHVHLFGVGDAGTACRVSDQVRRGLVFRGLVLLLDLGGGRALDLAYRERLATDLRACGIGRAALLGQNGFSSPICSAGLDLCGRSTSASAPNWRSASRTPNR